MEQIKGRPWIWGLPFMFWMNNVNFSLPQNPANRCLEARRSISP